MNAGELDDDWSPLGHAHGCCTYRAVRFLLQPITAARRPMPSLKDVVAKAQRTVEVKRERARNEVALIRARAASAPARANWLCLWSYLPTVNGLCEAEGFHLDDLQDGLTLEGATV